MHQLIRFFNKKLPGEWLDELKLLNQKLEARFIATNNRSISLAFKPSKSDTAKSKSCALHCHPKNHHSILGNKQEKRW